MGRLSRPTRPRSCADITVNVHTKFSLSRRRAAKSHLAHSGFDLGRVGESASGADRWSAVAELAGAGGTCGGDLRSGSTHHERKLWYRAKSPSASSTAAAPPIPPPIAAAEVPDKDEDEGAVTTVVTATAENCEPKPCCSAAAFVLLATAVVKSGEASAAVTADAETDATLNVTSAPPPPLVCSRR